MSKNLPINLFLKNFMLYVAEKARSSRPRSDRISEWTGKPSPTETVGSLHLESRIRVLISVDDNFKLPNLLSDFINRTFVKI
jgi:hypothetical protein